jgi:DNA modification methylase
MIDALDFAEGKNWSLFNGDSVEVLQQLPPASVGYSVFSPPFASLYTYSNSDRDLGNCKDHADFFEHYKFIMDGMFRVMKPGRLMSMHCMDMPTSKTRDGVIGARDFPGHLIAAAERAGFIFHSRVCIWKDPVTAMQRTKALGLLYKQIKKDSCMSRQGFADYVVTVRMPGENSEPVAKNPDDFPVSMWQHYASPVWMDINPSDTLQYRAARDSEDERHICPLQLDVIRRCVNLWSAPGDIVLSPFAGIGSEVYVAAQLGRKGLGIELKPSYFDQAVKNMLGLEVESVGLFEAA